MIDKKEYKEIMDSVVIARGKIISMAINLELLMSAFLAKHFCRDEQRQKEILETILATKKFMYDSKRDTIHAIINKPPYKEHLDANIEVFKSIQHIAQHRNVFAHYIVVVDENTVQTFRDGGIYFLKFSNSTTKEIYSKEKIKEVEESIMKATNFMSLIINAISYPSL